MFSRPSVALTNTNSCGASFWANPRRCSTHQCQYVGWAPWHSTSSAQGRARQSCQRPLMICRDRSPPNRAHAHHPLSSCGCGSCAVVGLMLSRCVRACCGALTSPTREVAVPGTTPHWFQWWPQGSPRWEVSPRTGPPWRLPWAEFGVD